ncbi:MAG: tRNA dihydrouridine synthase DusB [Deltaproteobacteria bacterium]|nr:tRNA dihydrouridine synthase DusB [Deltaproteobacteria bacterium]
MKIGSLNISDKTVLAPLAGITNLPFRLLVKSLGCGLVCSEMVSANGLMHGSEKTQALLKTVPDEKPLSIQIFGSDPEIVAEAAQIVEETGVDILDINFGCSVKKILKSGSGAALMKVPDKTRRILTAVRNAIGIPLTIKIRSGWEPSGKTAVEIAKIAEDCGVDAITIHPRTATQLFRGQADWSIIAAVKNEVTIPVIGNGDIATGEDAIAMMTQTGCDGVMMGRSAVSNPWIFSQVACLLQGKSVQVVNTSMRFDAMVTYLQSSVAYFGEQHACRMMRSRLAWFVKGLRFVGSFRESLKHISTQAEALEKIRSYREIVDNELKRI